MATDTLKVYKIGGNVLDNPEALRTFLTEFARIPGRKILVHGGGKEATRLGKSMGVPATMIDGRRVTDAETLKIVTMVYAGLVNKRVVSTLQELGCDAIGLTGADGNAITATKRPANPIDYGFVGDIATDGVNHIMIAGLINAGLTPVFCAITHDGHGNLLNCNADSIASAVATGMAQAMPTELVFCFEKDGVMRDINDPDSVIARINPDSYKELRACGAIVDGMIPKIDNAFKAVNAGVRGVTIRKSENILEPGGTLITNE